MVFELIYCLLIYRKSLEGTPAVFFLIPSVISGRSLPSSAVSGDVIDFNSLFVDTYVYMHILTVYIVCKFVGMTDVFLHDPLSAS